MANVKDKIQKLMDENGIASVTELSRRTEIPQPTIHKIISGETKKPRQGFLEKVSEYFGVSLSYFSADYPDDIKLDSNPVDVKLLKHGRLFELDESIIDTNLKDEIDLILVLGDDAFFPIFQTGAYLFITSDLSYLRNVGIYYLEMDLNNYIDINMTFYDGESMLSKSIASPSKNSELMSSVSEKNILGVILESRKYMVN